MLFYIQFSEGKIEILIKLHFLFHVLVVGLLLILSHNLSVHLCYYDFILDFVAKKKKIETENQGNKKSEKIFSSTGRTFVLH